jgi:hypothetical protein
MNNIIAKLYLQVSEQKSHNNVANSQFCQNIQINSKEQLHVTKISNHLIDNRWANLKIEA